MEKKIILTIAGSDPVGGAGIQADIRVATTLNVYACSVITAVTSQNTQRFSEVWEVSADQLRAQLISVFEDVTPDSVKIGLLTSETQIDIISQILKDFQPPNIVVDPVLSPTLSDSTPKKEFICRLSEELFPYATLVTPNAKELGTIENNISKKLIDICDAVLLKGGHSEGNICTDEFFHKETSNFNSESPSTAFPSLAFDKSFPFNHDNYVGDPDQDKYMVVKKEFSHKRVKGNNSHGSGCVLSSSIACFLAEGLPLEKAVEKGIKFVTKALGNSSGIKLGRGEYGPAFI